MCTGHTLGSNSTTRGRYGLWLHQTDQSKDNQKETASRKFSFKTGEEHPNVYYDDF